MGVKLHKHQGHQQAAHGHAHGAHQHGARGPSARPGRAQKLAQLRLVKADASGPNVGGMKRAAGANASLNASGLKDSFVRAATPASAAPASAASASPASAASAPAAALPAPAAALPPPAATLPGSALPILLYNGDCAVCRRIAAWVQAAEAKNPGGVNLIEKPIGDDPDALLRCV